MNSSTSASIDTSPETGSVIVQARQLTKQVRSPAGNLTILENVDLDIITGETAAIVGASGSGKSTLLSLLAGLDTPSSGEVTLLGQALTSLGEDGRARLRAGQVGFVFQAFQLLPNMTALENAMLPLELDNQADARKRATEVLEQVGLGSRIHHYPNQLSGGEQQRVAIARAYSINPKILFADEPTGNLDQNTGKQIIDILFRLNEDYKTTLVLVTHDMELSTNCSQRFELQEGRLQQ